MTDEPRTAVIIEDDTDIRQLISAVLAQSGFSVHAAADGAAGVEAVRTHRPDIVTLDLGLPDMDGFEVTRRLRQFSTAYIVMLTARADELDTLLGLEAGADDYLTKPFRPRELRARIEAMMRRPRPTPGLATGLPAEPPDTDSEFGHQAGAALPDQASLAGQEAPALLHPTPALEDTSPALRHAGLALDPGARVVTVDGSRVELTRTEFDLLQALLESRRMVRSKADLVHRLRFEDYDTGSFISAADERAVEVHMGNLRRKLGDDPRSPRWLETVRGVGYRLAG